MTASTGINQSKLNETFVVSSPMPQVSVMYGKNVFLITPPENNLNVLTETKANLSFFLKKKTFNPILFENALINFFKTLQSLRPMCGLTET